MESILIYLIAYVVIGVAFGIYADSLPFLRRRCSVRGGIAIRDALTVLMWTPLYALIGSIVMVASLLATAGLWVSDWAIWDKQIIRCGKRSSDG